MNLRPLTRARGRSLDADIAAYVPWGFGLDQAGGPEVLLPGALCAETSLGTAMVELVNQPMESLTVWSKDAPATDPTPLVDCFYVRLTPHIANQYGNNFRAARWGDFGDLEEARKIRFVRFAPGQLKFMVAVQAPGMEGSARDDGGPYDSLSWIAAYAKRGLIPGEIYEVEYVYELPYLKVKGVELVMCAEVWSPMRLEKYVPHYADAAQEERVKAILARSKDPSVPVGIWQCPGDGRPPQGGA